MVLDTKEKSTTDSGEVEGEDEFIELETSLDSVGPAVVNPAGAAAAGGDVEMGEEAQGVVVPDVEDGPERDPPASFEVSRFARRV